MSIHLLNKQPEKFETLSEPIERNSTKPSRPYPPTAYGKKIYLKLFQNDAYLAFI